ncbi:DMT family transporter [Candidatus Paracaedibacter symbiosus]|uniref:DMT family transporter n=1 Tax=Candidatus Paracaedibacter symbiosus TaxID=244582 RepID=UPI00050939AE|nr:DMT family transporter [Candidatus Paracaedibacter symbiosus]
MNIILFFITTFIWGTTWLAIKYQLGDVHPLWSVTYRFGLASLILVGACIVSRQSLRFSRKDHGWIALQALLLFSTNYLMYYFGTDYFISGVVAVLFASVTLMNIVNSRLFLGTPITVSTLAGAILGGLGLIFIFSAEVIRLSQENLTYIAEGLAFCLGGTLCASLGQTVATANMRRSLPVMQTNALGMAYGAAFTAIAALTAGIYPSFDFSTTYVGSLLYLSFFGTVLAFGSYLKLVGNIGSGRASYAFVVIPLMALIVSSMFEVFHWDIYSLLGVTMVLIGNWIVLARNAVSSKPARSF